MTAELQRLLGGASLAALPWLAGCAAGPAPEAAAPPPVSASLRTLQHGHGVKATFALCEATRCPQPTPKTLAPTAQSRLASTVQPAATGQDARPAHGAIASPLWLPTGQDGRAPLLTLHFPAASARLDAAASAALLAARPAWSNALRVTLVGHTDSTGVPAANARLAWARAEAVHRALRAVGLAAGTPLHIERRGDCCFLAPNDSAAGRARNRRVEVFVDPVTERPP